MRPAAAAPLVSTLSTWAVLALAGAYPIDNPDTFGHLALGRQIAELGHVPSHDTFSYFQPAGARFVNYEWLSDWLFFALYRAAGANGLQLLKLVISGLLAFLLVRTVQLRAARGATWLVPLLVLSGLPAVRFRWSVRPHLFGSVLGALYLLGLGRLLASDSPRERRAWIAGLALAHVGWVNLHGSHLLGLAFTGLACLCSLRDRARLSGLAVLFGLLLMASCVSPYGPAIVSGAIAHTLDPRYRALIEEWRSYRISQSLWYPASFCLQSALLALGAWMSRPGAQADRVRGHAAAAEPMLRRFQLLSAALLLLMAARSLRFLSDAVILTIPSVAIWLAPAWLARPVLRRAWTAALGGVLALIIAILGCVALPPQTRFGFGDSSRGRPEASARWLAAHWPDARILGEMADAWALMFSLPRARFLIDGRATFYGPEHLARVQRAWGSPAQLRALLDASSTQVVVAQPAVKEQQPAVQALLAAPDFQLMAIEAEHCVFARARPELSGLALRVLRPGYETGWLTAPGLDVAAAHGELARLPAHPNVQPYSAWVRAMLALRPMLREGGTAGLAAPRDAEQRQLLMAALHELRLSHEALPLVQTVGAYHGLVATLACELDEAREAFARTDELGQVRETLLGAQELALREGRVEEVREFLKMTGALEAAQGDGWLLGLKQELEAGARCDKGAR